MADTFKIEIISPEKTLLNTETQEVILPAFEGMMTILKNHISLVTFLRPGFIETKIVDKVQKFYVEEGTVEFTRNHLLILSSTAINIENLSNEYISKMIENSKNQLNTTDLKDKEKYILNYKIDTLQQINK
tara:strand:+ start:2409 stop:2801 length:393 start_codon:yes stop_codon:yes gene_type:complete